ncbi:MAG: hypothetical protein IH865_00435 [Chloroflexi bacterium]|nr:hypothetical protein [Chloroflexota bacterium]
MSSKLSEHIRQMPSRRDPPYRPAMTIDKEEAAELDKKLGDAANYDIGLLREMVNADPDNIEFRKALVSGIASAEYAGIDAFSRKVCEWQDWEVPNSLIMAMARQTWDEVRHARLATGVLESYGGKIGEYPDTLAGGAAGAAPSSTQGGGHAHGNGQQANGGATPQAAMQEPISMLSAVNVSLEGGALLLFKGTSELGAKIGDPLMERCFDYNWADEVTHTAIGDYFVKLLAEDDPEAEKRALRIHAMSEYGRTRLDEQQTEELKEFFADEMERATAALAGGGYAGQGAQDTSDDAASGG